jgi:hypothetical protein
MHFPRDCGFVSHYFPRTGLLCDDGSRMNPLGGLYRCWMARDQERRISVDVGQSNLEIDRGLGIDGRRGKV